MNRRQSKKILRRPGMTPTKGYPEAINRYRRDLMDSWRALGRWNPFPAAVKRHRRKLERPDGPPTLWWLSFCDGKTGKFLGACQVPAHGMLEAIRASHYLGINPGGDVRGIGADPKLAMLVPEKYIGVLMDKHECEIFEALMDEKIKEAGLVAHPGDRRGELEDVKQ